MFQEMVLAEQQVDAETLTPDQEWGIEAGAGADQNGPSTRRVAATWLVPHDEGDRPEGVRPTLLLDFQPDFGGGWGFLPGGPLPVIPKGQEYDRPEQ